MVSPGSPTSFDLAVVGGGSAGFAAATRGTELGARVALLEGGTLGGTCVNVGCVPSKTLLRAAEARHRRTHHGFAGVPSTDGRLDWGVVREEKDALVARLRQAKYADVLRGYPEITLIQQRAKLAPGGELTLADGQRIRAGKIVIATGSSPWAPPIQGLAEAGALDNASAMALPRLPESLIVIGGSAVGLELAQMFARLGVRVTMLEALSRILPGEDPAIGEALAEALGAEGLAIHPGLEVKQVARSAAGYVVAYREGRQEQEAVAEQLLLATGRRANTRGLGLESVQASVGAKDEILVNEFLQTGNPDIYAAGDVIGDPMFVYVAAYAGGVAADNALGSERRRYDLTAVPRVTFTDPAAASVGMSEAEALKQGLTPWVSRLSLEHVPRALAARDTRGFIKLVADPETRKLLGAQILAAEAGEMITEPALAIRFGLTIDDLTASFHPYLTLSEGIKLTAQAFEKDVRKLSCCAA
ncbi:MAG TPA: mercury(II) reductase [Gemmatimonadales bacterium]|nr:mercury(II) reductase [Gemmatimonadales bacterium]